MSKYKFDFSKEFERNYKRIGKKNSILQTKIDEVLWAMSNDPFVNKLRTHKVVTKRFGRCYSSRVTGDIRLIWNFSNTRLRIMIITVGGHSGKRKVYR
jgi:mRNA-degrading endonuclease YafQ of YafQ-DinJ toxin-antitoxin module